MVAPFILLIDQLTLILYNSSCKIIVKKWAGEKILRLLIVEDEKQMCDTIARSLYAAGYEVIPVMMARRLWNASWQKIMI